MNRTSIDEQTAEVIRRLVSVAEADDPFTSRGFPIRQRGGFWRVVESIRPNAWGRRKPFSATAIRRERPLARRLVAHLSGRASLGADRDVACSL